LIEASRPYQRAHDHPLNVADEVWVGVSRFHALTHPGLSFLLYSDGTPLSEAGFDLGAHVARLSHAKVTVLVQDDHGEAATERLQRMKEKLGRGRAAVETGVSPAAMADAVALESERQAIDLVVLGCNRQERLSAVEEGMSSGSHHMMVVTSPRPAAT